MQCRRTRAVLPAALWLAAVTAPGVRGGAEIDDGEFARLHALLAPPAEAWRELPWEASLLAARERAAREAKPIYMLVRSGSPLGCV
jgi:hypothetical protein